MGCATSSASSEVGGSAEAIVEAPSNPVIPASEGGVADPGVMRDVDGRYVMVSTGGSRGLYPIRVSDDLAHWEHVGYVFPRGTEPSWYDSAAWAPEMHRIGSRYAVFFSAKSKATGKMALGIATSDTAMGPFVDRGAPILGESPIGAIDSHYFHDPADGRHYMIWKQESNGLPPAGTPIYAQELSVTASVSGSGGDTFALIGERTELIRNDLPWEANLVEGPWMVARDGLYYLFYSANAYFDHRYATGVARTRTRGASLEEQLGTKLEKHGAPILASTSTDCWQGPGHGSILEAPDGTDVYVYHAWERGHVGSGSARVGLTDPVTWTAGWPAINNGKPSLGRCGQP